MWIRVHSWILDRVSATPGDTIDPCIDGGRTEVKHSESRHPLKHGPTHTDYRNFTVSEEDPKDLRGRVLVKERAPGAGLDDARLDGRDAIEEEAGVAVAEEVNRQRDEEPVVPGLAGEEVLVEAPQRRPA